MVFLTPLILIEYSSNNFLSLVPIKLMKINGKWSINSISKRVLLIPESLKWKRSQWQIDFKIVDWVKNEELDWSIFFKNDKVKISGNFIINTIKITNTPRNENKEAVICSFISMASDNKLMKRKGKNR